MGLNLTNATGQFLKNAGVPITTYPWSVGFWFWPKTTDSDIFCITISGVFTNYWEIGRAGGNFSFFTAAGGSETNAAAAGVIANQWNYGVARAISATNRRIHLLAPGGAITTAQDTNSKTPTGMDSFCIGTLDDGPTNPFDGIIAELWYTKNDIYPGGADIPDSLMRQLAYQGPFSSQHVMSGLVEYRSFREGHTAGDGPDIYFGSLGQQRWTATGNPPIGIHPPLPYSYNRPLETEQLIPFQRMFRTGVLDVVAAAAQAHLLEGKFAGTFEGKFG